MDNRTIASRRIDLPSGLSHATPSHSEPKFRAKARTSSRFLAAFLREPLTVGSFWPSSRALAEEIVGGCDVHLRQTVVELGPGTGAFTSLIVRQLRKGSRFLAIEINSSNAQELKRHFPRLEVYRDSAENLPSYFHPQDRPKADCIISGLAWGNMLPGTQQRIFDAAFESLAPNGLFTTFAYVHARWFPTTLRFRRCLFRHFSRVETTPVVWGNLPPAFVYRCWRGDSPPKAKSFSSH